MSEAVEKINHPYITRKEGVCGGKPIITGTRMRVQDIVIEYNQMGLTLNGNNTSPSTLNVSTNS